MTTKTQRLINRIEEKESFYDIAYLCEDFDTFIDEIAEWGVDHIGGVDFDDPEVNSGYDERILCFIRLYTWQPTPRREVCLMPHYIVESIEFDFSDSMGTIPEEEQKFITENVLGLWWVDAEERFLYEPVLDPEEALIEKITEKTGLVH